MSAYARGNAFEVRVANHLRKDGYLVRQTRGSKGSFDLIALKPGQVLLVQVKGGLAGMSGQEWNSLLHEAHDVDATPLLARRSIPRGSISYHRLVAPHPEGSACHCGPNQQTSIGCWHWPAVPWTADDADLNAAIARHPAGKRRP